MKTIRRDDTSSILKSILKIEMKTVVLLSLSLAVALGVPVLPPNVVQHPDEDQSPLLGDRVPVQGHVVVENPAPQISPSSDKNAQTPEDLKPKEDMKEAKPEVKAEPEVEEELQAEPDFKVESEVKVELNMVEKEVEVKPEAEELEPDDFKVESEVKVELDVQSEEPEEPHEFHPAMMKDVAETVMKSEPLNDDDDDDDGDGLEEEVNQKELLSEEISIRQEDFVAGTLPEEEEEKEKEEDMVEGEEEFLRTRDVLDEPVMEVEPEMTEEAEPIPVEDEESVMEQLSEIYLPGEEAQMRFVRETEAEEDLQLGVRQQASFTESRQGGSSCPGQFIDGKCYQFFKAAKNYADAEFFCQEQFSGGHLASITSPSAHREVMNLILTQNGGYTRTWVGGRRLDDHRFVWLDGSRWTYDDWLSGEPNNTSGVEDCVEVLPLGNGKFNDFTCWEPQAFICSYPQ